MQDPPLVSFSMVSRVFERPVAAAPNCSEVKAPDSNSSSPSTGSPSTSSVTSVPDRPM